VNTASDLEVRPARRRELAGLVRLLAAQFREHQIALPEAEIARAAAGMFRYRQRGRFLVAVQAGKLYGVAALSFVWTLERGGRTAWLDELYVVPERRGRGIGTALLRAAIDSASAAGALAVDLEIDAGHQRAAGLYRRAGFMPLPRMRWARAIDASPGRARRRAARRSTRERPSLVAPSRFSRRRRSPPAAQRKGGGPAATD
jgi:GNAT superfamily N-acetyltransferase